MRTLAVLAVALLTACEPAGRLISAGDDGEEALASLRAPTASARFGLRYWSKVQEGDSALWRRAVIVCQAIPPGDTPPGCQRLYELHVYDLHAHRDAQEAVAPTSRDTPLDLSRAPRPQAGWQREGGVGVSL